ncbi:DUF975 family protein [Vagococcus xieshaowenii]|uniref:DUF975 family protein n=1 Tax=Vagococcus xieshaowenii TaxID=2562451 RepID=A0AAJ5JLK6_9ENTE|nr:DUF975 family protein [Vagococcus xieshaowenii]QCA29334.1 DUF975 family protein [Vagococcus xieshaowenii]TFZ42462.1 DUF975 family protein [Vagococcus xieshaowenii]
MKTSGELKRIAKSSLEGKWVSAIALNLVPVLLNVILMIIPFMLAVIGWLFLSKNFNISTDSFDFNTKIANGSDFWDRSSSLISSLFFMGISWTHLSLVRDRSTKIMPLEDNLKGFKSGVIGNNFFINIMVILLTALWSLLFVIPGIVKSYSYSQVNYLFHDRLENEESVQVMELITDSRQLMDGHKGRLFALDLSFVGWHLLAMLTLGIGYLWLTPYINATKAAFYQDLIENS